MGVHQASNAIHDNGALFHAALISLLVRQQGSRNVIDEPLVGEYEQI